MNEGSNGVLPGHYDVGRGQMLFSAGSIAAAVVLLGSLGYGIAIHVDLWRWWIPLAFLGGVAAADFLSGLVHWGADTWGRDDCPVIGRRLLVPFRVHHVNPDDLLRRRFVDANGDVAFVVVPALIALHALPLDRAWAAPIAIVGFGCCAIGGMTNQIHQWAHNPSPPRAVRLLQASGLFLGRAEHAAHHERPYDSRYCITTGWCNRPLEAIGFFRRLEALITRLSGVAPRHDDRRYETRFGA